jgi:hypothetical protein
VSVTSVKHGTYKGSSSNRLFHKETDRNPSQARVLNSADLYVPLHPRRADPCRTALTRLAREGRQVHELTEAGPALDLQRRSCLIFGTLVPLDGRASGSLSGRQEAGDSEWGL